MYLKEIAKRQPQELKDELLSLLRKQLNLRIQASNNQLKQTHLLKISRRNIARIKTLIK